MNDKSDLAQALEARERRIRVFDVTGIFGLGNRPIHKVAVRVPRIGEQEQAVVAAHHRVAEMAKAIDHAKDDPDIMVNAKSMEIIQRACLTEDGKTEVFAGGAWMRENFTDDEAGVLMNLVNEFRLKESAIRWDLSVEKVEAIIALCVRASTTDLPERVLARYQREYLTSLVVYLCNRLHAAERPALGLTAGAVKRNEDGTYTWEFEGDAEAEWEPLPDDFLDDPDAHPDVAEAVPDKDEES